MRAALKDERENRVRSGSKTEKNAITIGGSYASKAKGMHEES